MQVIDVIDHERDTLNKVDRLYLFPISLWTMVEVGMEIYAGFWMFVLMVLSLHGTSQEPSKQFYSFTVAALIVLVANISTVLLSFTSQIRILKYMLFFKVVEDSLLALYINPVTRSSEEGWTPYFAGLVVITIYELYWSSKIVGIDFRLLKKYIQAFAESHKHWIKDHLQ